MINQFKEYDISSGVLKMTLVKPTLVSSFEQLPLVSFDLTSKMVTESPNIVHYDLHSDHERGYQSHHSSSLARKMSEVMVKLGIQFADRYLAQDDEVMMKSYLKYRFNSAISRIDGSREATIKAVSGILVPLPKGGLLRIISLEEAALRTDYDTNQRAAIIAQGPATVYGKPHVWFLTHWESEGFEYDQKPLLKEAVINLLSKFPFLDGNVTFDHDGVTI